MMALTEAHQEKIIQAVVARLRERLSAAEKKRRKRKKIFANDPHEDADQGDELRTLANGVANRSEEIDEAGCVGNPLRNNQGEYASKDEPGSWTMKKRKGCPSGQYRRSKGSSVGSKSEEPCGRRKRKTGQFKCRDGESR